MTMESVGDYEYNRKNLIGHGAFALVYEGRHKKTKQSVAIKCINKKNLGRSSALLGKEIKILKELQHDNIVRLFECESSTQSYYLVMEYCNGGDLADYLHKKGTLSEDTLRLFLRQIANAMNAMHKQGILHRDLKPQNILLSHKMPKPKPVDIIIKIADFGFARHLQSDMMAATLCGSPMYMAPEVITSKMYDAKADLWSVGTIAYQCIAGKAPFQASTPQELRNFYEQTKKVEPKIPPGTSTCLRDLLRKLLTRNVSKRIDFNGFFNHRFLVAVKTKSSSPVPVPARVNSFSATPNSSNNSDARSIIGESPHTATDCSPSEGDPLFLRLSTSSSRDSEDFVMVSHPCSSTDSFNNNPQDCSRGNVVDERKNINVGTPSKHIGPGPHRPRNTSISDASRHGPSKVSSSPQMMQRESSVRSPFLMHRTSSGASSPLTVRYSPASVRARSGSDSPASLRARSGSDSDASNRSKPSPVPIPVPTQVENYERIERKSSVSSNSSSSFEDRSRHFHSRSQSMSPLCIDSNISRTNSNHSLSRSPHLGTHGKTETASMVRASPVGIRKARKLSGATPSEFSPIIENPYDMKAKVLSKANCTNMPRVTPNTVVACRMSRAQTVPDLAKFEVNFPKVNNPISRSKSSVGLSEQVMRIFFGNTSQPSTFSHISKRSDSLTTIQLNPKNTLWTPPHRYVQNTDDTILQKARQFIPSETSPTINRNTNWVVGTPPSLTDALTPPLAQSPVPVYGHGFASGELKLLTEEVCHNNPTNLESSLNKSDHVDSTLDNPAFDFTHDISQSRLDRLSPNDDGQSSEVREFQFYCRLSDCIGEVAEEHVSHLACDSVPYLELSYIEGDPLHNITHKQRQCEQFLLYLRALQVLATALHTIRNKVNAGTLLVTSSIKEVVHELNVRYKRFCQLCQTSKGQCNLDQAKLISFVSADKILYFHAVNDCRTAALDEMFEGKIKQCLQKYRRALLLLEGISLCTNSNIDRSSLSKYKRGIDHRLRHLTSQVSGKSDS